MIKAVFFDLYNTLVGFEPRREEVQQRACREFGIDVTKRGILEGYVVADDYMARENARSPLSQRNEDERRDFFGDYERLILAGAGVEISADRAGEIFRSLRKIPYDLAAFDDSALVLNAIRERGVKTGLITNLSQDVWELCEKLRLAPHLDLAVTSEEAGAAKPHPGIFKLAMKKAGVAPEESMHVGDDYSADVMGAQEAGMKAILIDRDDLQGHVDFQPKIRKLEEVLAFL